MSSSRHILGGPLCRWKALIRSLERIVLSMIDLPGTNSLITHRIFQPIYNNSRDDLINLVRKGNGPKVSWSGGIFTLFYFILFYREIFSLRNQSNKSFFFLTCPRSFPSTKKSLIASETSHPTIGRHALKKCALKPSGPRDLHGLACLMANSISEISTGLQGFSGSSSMSVPVTFMWDRSFKLWVFESSTLRIFLVVDKDLFNEKWI